METTRLLIFGTLTIAFVDVGETVVQLPIQLQNWLILVLVPGQLNLDTVVRCDVGCLEIPRLLNTGPLLVGFAVDEQCAALRSQVLLKGDR